MDAKRQSQLIKYTTELQGGRVMKALPSEKGADL